MLTSSNVAFTAASDLFIEINGGAPGTGYDQLNVRGTNQLGGATLHVSGSYAPAQNDSLIIISNDGAEPVLGTFAGLPDGAPVMAGGNEYRIRYNAGGNDVRLVYTNSPAVLTGTFLVSGGNGDFVLDPGECVNFTMIVSNITGTPISGISARLEARSSGVAITQPFATFPDIPGNARGSNATPFQVSILPDLPCGEDMSFDLVLETATHGSFRLRFFTPTASAGPLVRFDNNTASPIPDLGTNNSTILVSGITTELRNVIVSMHITHTAADDLDIQLISPNGTIVTLSSDNGATASDYGTSCADAQRTTFSMSAATAITAASAPFVGTFRPEQSLGAFFGDSGADVNGTWTLRVIDDAGGAVGTLRCWSLMLSPATCAPGGGPCEVCPEATIFGFVGTNSSVQTGRLTDNGLVSSCAAPKTCPSLFTALPRFADAFTFVNEESNACITVSLQSTANLFSVAYRRYNPGNLCLNYLADMGRSTSDGGSNYSFNVAAGSEFVVVVHQIDASDVGQYRLDVTGGSCRPRLHITQVAANRAVLDWTTAAADYGLEIATSLAPPVWSPIVTPPVVIASQYTVTNTIPAFPANRFFRLRKP
jgi:subtilisin-like proprotein convertase family protein